MSFKIEETNSYNNQDNLSKCCNCNDAPGDFILDNCLHNICNYCVATCLEIRDIYNCPKCLTKSKISANIFLPILGKQPVKNCNWCEVGNETNSATGYCNECDAYLCPECIKGHCRMPQFRSHYVKLKNESIGKTLRNCDSHPNEALDIYCETCEKLTCRDCQLSLHKEHKHQWIGEKAKEMETSLTGLKSKLMEKLNEMNDLSTSAVSNRESLVTNVKLAKDDLHNYIQAFTKCQQGFFENMEVELGHEAGSREQKLVEISLEINKAKESIQHCMNLLNKIASSNEPSILIQVTPKLLKYISVIIDRFESDHDAFQPFLDLEFSESRFVSSKSPTEVLNQIGFTKFGNVVSNQPKGEKAIETLPMDEIAFGGPDEMDDWASQRNFCSVCNEPGIVICCSSCESLFHQGCHVPRLTQLPNTGDWLCTSCINPKKFILEPTDRSMPHKGRLNKKERKVVARIFLEILQFHDWSIFVNDDASKTVATLDLEKVRFNIENKIYTSIDKFIADLRQIFQQTAERYQSQKISRTVAKFQQRLNLLLQKYIPSEIVVQFNNEAF